MKYYFYAPNISCIHEPHLKEMRIYQALQQCTYCVDILSVQNIQIISIIALDIRFVLTVGLLTTLTMSMAKK